MTELLTTAGVLAVKFFGFYLFGFRQGGRHQ